MALTPVPAFTPTNYAQLAAQAFAKAQKLTLTGGNQTLRISNLGGSPAVVLLSTPAKSTTAAAAVGTVNLTLADATSVAVGQLAIGAGIPDGTFVEAVVGSVATISAPLTVAMAGTDIDFVVPVTNPTGIAIPINAVMDLGLGSNTYIGYVSQSGGYSAPNGLGAGSVTTLNIASGS